MLCTGSRELTRGAREGEVVADSYGTARTPSRRHRSYSLRLETRKVLNLALMLNQARKKSLKKALKPF